MHSSHLVKSPILTSDISWRICGTWSLADLDLSLKRSMKIGRILLGVIHATKTLRSALAYIAQSAANIKKIVRVRVFEPAKEPVSLLAFSFTQKSFDAVCIDSCNDSSYSVEDPKFSEKTGL